MEFYLISTDHLCTQLWFRDDSDFKVAMNYISVVAFITGIHILAFALMSNHVHFVVECDYATAYRFINLFKQDHAAYYRKKYGVKTLLRRNSVDIQALPLNGESVERGIAYTLMNPVAANICLYPTEYRWCCCDAFFRNRPVKGTPLRELSARAQAKILRSHARLPQTWILNEDGYIQPDSYVSVRFVESLFRTPNRFNFFLRNSSKAKARMERRDEGLPSFRDQVIGNAIADLCISLFKKSRTEDLNREEWSELLRQIRYRFSADLHQISRIVGKTYDETAKLLDAL